MRGQSHTHTFSLSLAHLQIVFFTFIERVEKDDSSIYFNEIPENGKINKFCAKTSCFTLTLQQQSHHN